MTFPLFELVSELLSTVRSVDEMNLLASENYAAPGYTQLSHAPVGQSSCSQGQRRESIISRYSLIVSQLWVTF